MRLLVHSELPVARYAVLVHVGALDLPLSLNPALVAVAAPRSREPLLSRLREIAGP